AAATAVPTAERPPWLDRDASAEPPPVRLISPALADDEAAPRAAADRSRLDRDKALAPGKVVHRLLQSLPRSPSAARPRAPRPRGVTGLTRTPSFPARSAR